jgi:hypothetical protein
MQVATARELNSTLKEAFLEQILKNFMNVQINCMFYNESVEE